MAKSHVIQLYLEAENQYFEMLDCLKEFKQLAEENKVTQEEFVNFSNEVAKVKENYTNLGYFMYTLNLPRRKSKKLDKTSQSWYDMLTRDSKRGLLDENVDVLCEMKKLLKEKKGIEDANK